MTSRNPAPLHHARTGGAAFSLIGLLLVTAIVLWLMFGASSGGGKTYMQTVVQAKKDGNALAITMQARQLAIFVADFRMNHADKNPATFEDMGADPASFRDQWGQTLRFSFPPGPPRDAKLVIVTSSGPDAQPDTTDDIVERIPLPY